LQLSENEVALVVLGNGVQDVGEFFIFLGVEEDDGVPGASEDGVDCPIIEVNHSWPRVFIDPP
jgi:hypothetical protein